MYHCMLRFIGCHVIVVMVFLYNIISCFSTRTKVKYIDGQFQCDYNEELVEPCRDFIMAQIKCIVGLAYTNKLLYCL